MTSRVDVRHRDCARAEVMNVDFETVATPPGEWPVMSDTCRLETAGTGDRGVRRCAPQLQDLDERLGCWVSVVGVQFCR